MGTRPLLAPGGGDSIRLKFDVLILCAGRNFTRGTILTRAGGRVLSNSFVFLPPTRPVQLPDILHRSPHAFIENSGTP